MILRKNSLSVVRFILALLLFFPFSVYAHLISIQTVTPFPTQINTSATATASYTVTNISRIPIMVVDQSHFPSSLAISSSTCGSLMSPGASCAISVTLTAPATATTISSELREWAKPSADGIKVPISVRVVASTQTFTVTPSAGVGGSISPSTPQSVSRGGSVTFTATPNAGFAVDQWLVDGVSVQTGGTTYTLSNVTASHTVSVTFVVSGPILSIGGGASDISTQPLIIQSSDSGVTWSAQEITLVGGGGTYRGSACTGTGATARCIFGGDYIAGGQFPSYAYTQNGGTTWNSVLPGGAFSRFFGAGATGTGTSAVLLLVGESGPSYIVSTDGGDTFSSLATFAGGTGSLRVASCTDSQPNALCIVGGFGSTTNANQLFIVLNINGTVTPSYPSIPGYTTAADVNGVSCTGTGTNTRCVIVGSDNLLAVSTDRGVNWTLKTAAGLPALVRYFGVSCQGSGSTAFCVAVGIDDVTFDPLIVQSTNGGNTWAIASTTGLISTDSLISVSCFGNTCAAVGGDATSPYVISTTNKGTSWSAKTITGTPQVNRFASVTCSGNGTVVCHAIGPDGGGTPFLAASTDGGASWSYQTVTGMPSSATLLATAATTG